MNIVRNVIEDDNLTVNFIVTKEGNMRITYVTVKKDQDKVVIPSIINDIKVTEFGANIRSGNHKYNEVVLPKYLTSIRYCTFGNDTKLKKITIPKEVVTIEDNAFECCSNLSEVNFEKGSKLKKICHGAFYGCKKLKRLVLPYGCEEANAIFEEESKTVLVVPSTIKHPISHPYVERPFSIDNLVELARHEENKFKFNNTIGSMTHKGITYDIFDGLAVVKKISKELDDIVIAKEVTYENKKYPVKAILPKAIEVNNNDKKDHYNSLVLPETMEVICPHAISDLYIDDIVSIPSSIRQIGRGGLRINPVAFYIENTNKELFKESGLFESTNNFLVKNNAKFDYEIYSWTPVIALAYGNAAFISNVNLSDVALIDNTYYLLKEGCAAILGLKKEVTEYKIKKEITYKNKKYKVNTLYNHALLQAHVEDLVVPSSIEYVFNYCFYGKGYRYEDPSTLVAIGAGSLKDEDYKFSNKLRYIFSEPVRLIGMLDIDRDPNFDFSNIEFLGKNALNCYNIQHISFSNKLRVLGYTPLPHKIESVEFDDDASLEVVSTIIEPNSGFFKDINTTYIDGGYYFTTSDGTPFYLHKYDLIGRPIIDIPEGVVVINVQSLEYANNLVELNLPSSLRFLNSELYLAKDGVVNLNSELLQITKTARDYLKDDPRIKNARYQNERSYVPVHYEEVRWYHA